MKKITVAIPSYNHAPYLREAVQSALSQEGCQVEVVIVDDGSVDDSMIVAKSITDPRVKVISFPKNQGACVALNRAIHEGTGEYVAVLNSDDLFLPGKLLKQFTFLEENPHISAVFGLPQFIDETGKSLEGDAKVFEQPNRSRHEWLRHFFYQGNCLCHPTILIRRDCYLKHGVYDPRLVQAPDFDFWIRLMLKEEIHIMNEPCLIYRVFSNGANASSPRPDHLRRSQWEITQILKHYLSLAPEEYLKVFPEDSVLADRIGLGNTHFVSLALAYRALGEGIPPWFQPSYSLFGLQVIHELLREDQKKEHWTLDAVTIKELMHYSQRPIFKEDHPTGTIPQKKSLFTYIKSIGRKVIYG